MNIKKPTHFMGVKIDGAMKRALAEAERNSEDRDADSKGLTGNEEDISDFIYLPTSKIYVAREKTLHGKDWLECHEELQNNNGRMLIIPEFIEFLNHLKSQANNQEYREIYNEITEVRDPWRAEWLDADFKVKDKKLYVNYNTVLDSNGYPIPGNSEVLDKETLMKDKFSGISLESWLADNGHTKQWLPSKNVKPGSLYYWCPESDDNSVASFSVGSGGVVLDCSGGPDYRGSGLGVRKVLLDAEGDNGTFFSSF